MAIVADRVPGAVVSYNTNNNRDTARCHTHTIRTYYLQRIDFMINDEEM